MAVRFGACVLDPERRELRRGGEPVHLSPKAFDLLLALLERRPSPCPERSCANASGPRPSWTTPTCPTWWRSCAMRSETMRAARASFAPCTRSATPSPGPVTEGRRARSRERTRSSTASTASPAWRRSSRGITCWAAATSPRIYLDAADRLLRRHARLRLAHGHGILEDLAAARHVREGRETDRTPASRRRRRVLPGVRRPSSAASCRANDPVDTRWKPRSRGIFSAGSPGWRGVCVAAGEVSGGGASAAGPRPRR